MFSPYYDIARKLFPNAKIVLDRFHIVQHLSRAMNCLRIQIMKLHLTNKEILEKILYCSQELQEHYKLYQLLLFHFQEKQAGHFFGLIEDTLSCVNPIFQTVFKTFLKDKDKILNALELPYSMQN